MHYIISIINIFYLFTFTLFLFFWWVFFLFFKEKFKEISVKLFIFYLVLYVIFCNIISYMYVENIIIFFSILLEENFIIKNPDDCVWMFFSLTTFLTFIFFIPYFSFIIYTILNTGFYQIKQQLVLFFNFFFFYSILLSFFLLATDFVFAGLTSLAYNNNMPFEFQYEIESFLIFIFGTFWDFLFTSIFLNISIFIFLFSFNNKNYLYQILSIFFIFYWFAGISFLQDLLLLIIIWIMLQFINWFKIFICFLAKYL